MKSIRSNIITALILFLSLPGVLTAFSLDIGNELSMEYRSHSRKDAEDYVEALQRARFYLTGMMDNNINVSFGINSTGILNSTESFVWHEGRLINNAAPFVDTAFVEAVSPAGLPLSIRAGRQPIRWGEGVLVNDMGRGFPALLLSLNEPFTGINAEVFRTWFTNDERNINEITGTGLRLFRQLGPGVLEFNYIFEEYTADTYDPLLDPADIERVIYGGRYSQEPERGLEYSFFAYFMDGKKRDKSFDAHALGAYGRFEGVVEPLGRGGTWIRFLLGSGDEEGLDDDLSFTSMMGGVGTSVIGDYYGRMREFMMVDGQKTAYTRSNSIANISILSFGIYANPIDALTVHMVRNTYKEERSENPFGGSLTLGGSYTYGLLDMELNYTVFAPETIYDRYDGDRSTKVLSVLVNARF